MGEVEYSLPANSPPAAHSLTCRAAGAIAITGGILALAVAALVTISVLGRWLINTPIEGDFEFVKMATAIGVFCYLPFTQIRRGNIFVDTFTGWLPERWRNLIDAFWDFCFAVFMGFCSIGLSIGFLEALKSGETTMQRQLLIWPVIGICAALCIVLTLAALSTSWRLLRARP